MSLDVILTLEDVVDQVNKYKKQLENAENAVQQIKGAIAACEHQMQLLVNKQNELALKNASVEADPEQEIADSVPLASLHVNE